MKKTTIAAVIAMVLICTSAYAYDASSAYSTNMIWYIPESTTFTVTLAGTEADIFFNTTLTTETQRQPRGQDAAGNVAMINVTNTGNIAQNFTHSVQGAAPTGVTLKFSRANSYAGAAVLSFGAGANIMDNLNATQSTRGFFWTDFAGATPSATNQTRVYYVNSSRYTS